MHFEIVIAWAGAITPPISPGSALSLHLVALYCSLAMVDDAGPNPLRLACAEGLVVLRDSLELPGYFLLPWLARASLQDGHQASADLEGVKL